MTPKPPEKDALKKKANDLRKALAQLDKITGQAFTVSRRAEVAAFFGVSLAALDKWIQQGMPGGRGCYDLHKVVIWLRTEGPWRPRGGGGVVEDLVTEAPESEWSEEYRKWKARIAQLEYEERIGQLMRVDEGQRIWADTVMPLVRGFAERVIKAHGNGTAQDWDDTCQQIDGAIERAFSDRGTDGHETDIQPSMEGLDDQAAPEPPAEPDRLGGSEDPNPDGTVCGPAVPTQQAPS